MKPQYLFFKSVFNREDGGYNRYVIDAAYNDKYALIELSPAHKPNLIGYFDNLKTAEDYFNDEFNLELK